MKFFINQSITLLSLFFLSLVGVSGQEITILDSESGLPVPNVALVNKDRSKSALSDFNGKANLDVFDRRERIEFRHLSYELLTLDKRTIQNRNLVVYLEIKPEELEEVVMSISRWEQQRKDIPHKISTIDAQSIAFANPQTSADLLQQSGKVFVQKSQLGGGSPMIRGFATNRLLLSVDGVRMNNAIFRGGNLQNVISIDPFSVRNVEVIFGPGSVIYGSDAIGGVLNFYTKKPRFAFQDSLLLTGDLYYRHSTASREHTTHAEIGIGKKQWAFLSSLSFNSFGDLTMGRHGPEDYLRQQYVSRISGQDQLLENPNPRRQVPTGFEQTHFMQKVAYKPNNNWLYELGIHYSQTGNYSRYDRLIRPDESGDGLRSAEWFYGPQKWFMGNAQMTHKAKKGFYDGLKLTAAYQFFEESRNSRDFGDLLRYRTAEQVNAYSLNLDLENKKLGNFDLFYGLEYVGNLINSAGQNTNISTSQVLEAPSRYPDDSSWETLAGYVNSAYNAKPNLTFLAGMRYSHVWIDAPFSTTFYPFPFEEARLNNGALTGSLGLSWLPASSWQLTLNGSTAFRAPNIDDIGKIFDSEPGAVVVPNPDLEPEYAYNVEFGVRKNIKDKILIQGAAYYTYLVDALVRRDFLFNGQSEIMYNGEMSRVQAIQNAARAYVYGFEFGMEASLSPSLALKANLTMTSGVEEDDDGVDSPSRHAAPTFADIGLEWENRKLKTELFLNYNGEIANEDLALSEQAKTFIYARDADGLPYSPSWYTLNVRSQYKLGDRLAMNLLLENITDQRYQTYSSGIAAPGFNLSIGVGYSF